MKLPFHCDGSDLVGLMCLDPGAEDGLSRVANAVSLHNLLRNVSSSWGEKRVISRLDAGAARARPEVRPR